MAEQYTKKDLRAKIDKQARKQVLESYKKMDEATRASILDDMRDDVANEVVKVLNRFGVSDLQELRITFENVIHKLLPNTDLKIMFTAYEQ